MVDAFQDFFISVNLGGSIDQIGVDGVRLLSCWLHLEGFFQDFSLFPGQPRFAIIAYKQGPDEFRSNVVPDAKTTGHEKSCNGCCNGRLKGFCEGS